MGVGFSNEKGVIEPSPWYGQGAGCETPSSEPGCSLTDRWEEDFPLRQEDGDSKSVRKKEQTRSKSAGPRLKGLKALDKER